MLSVASLPHTEVDYVWSTGGNCCVCYPLLLPMKTVSLFRLHDLNTSLKAYVITAATRGHRLTIIIISHTTLLLRLTCCVWLILMKPA